MNKKVLSLSILLTSDLIVIFLSYFLSYLIRSEILPTLFIKFKDIPLHPFSNFLNNYYMAIVWLFIFAYEKLYTKRYPFWEEVRILLKSATISSFVMMIFIFITNTSDQFSRTIVILAWLLSLILFPLLRFLTKTIMVNANLWTKKLFIIGVNETSLSVLKNIKKNKTMGYEVIGLLDDDPKKIGKKYHGVEVLGSVSELENITNAYKSKDIMIAALDVPRKELKKFLSECESLSDSMWFVPSSGDFITEGVEIEVLGQVLTLSIKKNLAKPFNILIKTLFDKSLAFIIIILILPLVLFICLAIKFDSKGPVIFLNKRMGKNKKMFNLLKFRSMYLDNDLRLSQYLDKNREIKEEWDRFKKLKNNDPRVTRAGKILRKYSLDELPQFINVLQGKMSLVGPRPYIFEELKGRDSFINMVSRVRPGITGLWQISGRSDLPFKERLYLDEYYIRNWSLWLDIVILIKSLKILSGKGAY